MVTKLLIKGLFFELKSEKNREARSSKEMQGLKTRFTNNFITMLLG
jgi:hypothetical protein